MARISTGDENFTKPERDMSVLLLSI